MTNETVNKIFFDGNNLLFIAASEGFNKNYDKIRIETGDAPGGGIQLEIELKRKELKKLFIAIRERLRGEYPSTHFTRKGKFILHPPDGEIIEKSTEEVLRALKV
jgi:hypothetical protein